MGRSRGSASGKGEREGALSPFFVQGNLEKKISPKGKNPLGEILLLANVVFVNRGVVVVLYQIDGVDVLVKDAGVNELLDVRVQENLTQVPQEELSFLGTGISIGFWPASLSWREKFTAAKWVKKVAM